MRNTQHKGDIATAHAITYFTEQGYDVSLPLTESAAYDLLVDVNSIIYRIQVKFTSGKEVDLRNIHSNSNGYVIKKVKPGSYDWLFIFKKNGEKYLIKECLSERRSVTCNLKYKV